LSFLVHPSALRIAAAQLDNDAATAQFATRYIARHSAAGWHGQGAINSFIGAHQDFVASLDRRLKHLADLLETSSKELVKVAMLYERTDTKSAAAMDATYPPVARHGLADDH
jgi:uncharacterized protein YukE